MINYIHAFWTKPALNQSQGGPDSTIDLPAVEALTWLLSICQARRFGTIRLVTDTRGRQFAERTGLAPFYSGGISTELDEIPVHVNPELFWSCAKLYAFKRARGPTCCLDPDCVLWQALRPRTPVIALFRERLQPCYRDNRRKFAAFGFDGPEWNWRVRPLGTGLVHFQRASDARAYARKAIRFVEGYSRFVEAKGGAQQVPVDPSETANFAEQRVLGMFLARQGLGHNTLAPVDYERGHFHPNPWCIDLWGTKTGYQLCPGARHAAITFLIGFLKQRHPETLATLRRWGLEHLPKAGPKLPSATFNALPDRDRAKVFRLPRSRREPIWLRDPNFPMIRPACGGDLALVAEQELAASGPRTENSAIDGE